MITIGLDGETLAESEADETQEGRVPHRSRLRVRVPPRTLHVVRNSKSHRSNSERLRAFLVLYTPLDVMDQHLITAVSDPDE